MLCHTRGDVSPRPRPYIVTALAVHGRRDGGASQRRGACVSRPLCSLGRLLVGLKTPIGIPLLSKEMSEEICFFFSLSVPLPPIYSGVLPFVGAEMIPIEPDAGNAAEGMSVNGVLQQEVPAPLYCLTLQ